MSREANSCWACCY